MSIFRNMGARLGSLTDSVSRYPITVAFLVAAAVMNLFEIENDGNFTKLILGSVIGAVACAAAQASYERFFTRAYQRILLLTGGVLLSVVFYLCIRQVPDSGVEIVVRTAVAVFALFISYIWIAVIKSNVSFNESFMAAFKALFQSAFFSGIIFLGCIAVIAAIDRLIVRVDSNAYGHTANIVFVLFAPVFFLSLIPVYPGRTNQMNDGNLSAKDELIVKRTGCPRFLEVLLSYIIIPLAAAFTMILVIYIVLNISGRFWTDNLLEPMLVSYSITVIAVTILTGRLENKFAVLFKTIFPKVLIPIALFQVAASVLIMTDTGVTYARYYVILYGGFAVFSGVVFSFLANRKNGIIAAALILLSAISLIPPVDAFTVSRNSQVSTLEAVLIRNGMLQDDKVTPNGTITEEDQEKIIDAVRYLDETNNLDSIGWLPEGFHVYDDISFEKAFGFSQYGIPDTEYSTLNVHLDSEVAIPIAGYDYFTQMYIQLPNELQQPAPISFEHQGKSYELFTQASGGSTEMILREGGGELVSFDIGEIFSRYEPFTTDKYLLSLEEATFEKTETAASFTIVVQSASMDFGAQLPQGYADILILIRLEG